MVKRGAGQCDPTSAESFSGVDGVQRGLRLMKRECVCGVEKIKKLNKKIMKDKKINIGHGRDGFE